MSTGIKSLDRHQKSRPPTLNSARPASGETLVVDVVGETLVVDVVGETLFVGRSVALLLLLVLLLLLLLVLVLVLVTTGAWNRLIARRWMNE